MQPASLRQDARVIGLVGLAHGVSHFYHLILAALFPWLKPEFDLSYAQLGLLMTVFFVVSGVGQALAGFVVDRVGASRVLFGGIALLGVAAVVLAGAHGYPMLLAGSMLAGVGNSVFHPADYTLAEPARIEGAPGARLLDARHQRQPRLGRGADLPGRRRRAVELAHRGAGVGRDSVHVLLLLFFNRHALRADPVAPGSAWPASQGGSFDFLRLPTVWMCFGFFFLSAVALGGIQSFASTSLVALYHVSLASATTAYTAYMLASAGGMVAGGFVAARARTTTAPSSSPSRWPRRWRCCWRWRWCRAGWRCR